MPKTTPNKPKKSHIDWRRILVTVLALLMVLALVLPLISSVFTSAQAVTQEELKNQIAGLKGDASEASERKKELEAQIKAIESDLSKAMERKNLLDRQLYAINDEIANTQKQINTYMELIAAQEEALAQAQAEEDYAYARFCQRARSMEEGGEFSYWSVLFSAVNFSDLLDRLAMVDLIMEYDNSVVDALTAAREAVEAILADLNETKAGLDEQMSNLETQRYEQGLKVDEAQALMNELLQKEEHANDLLKAQVAEEEKIAKELTAKEKELERLILEASFTTGSGYFYPLPIERTYVTSRFGLRVDPITGQANSNHNGMDIPAPAMTPIYAVQGGVVITSAFASASYGQYVAISHGNGIVTLYGHMTKGSQKVKEGDIVSQGQIIGYVGSTGRSTGPHLHLELRKDGVRQDPEQMFPGVQFTFKYNY